MNCPHCGGVASPGLVACPKCGGHISSAVGGLKGVGASSLVPASEVKEASIERIQTGGAWDTLFGGGIVRSQCVLFGGMPGGGKTTLLLQKASAFAAVTGLWSYVISAEQSSGELKITINRLELPNADKILVLKEFGAGAELSDDVFKKYPPGFIMLDSLTALCGEDVRAQLAVAKNYKKYSVKYNAPSFIINQMTKEFDFAGLLKLQHEVDTIATIRPAEPRDPRRYRGMEDARAAEVWKNRFGARRTDINASWFDMTPKGFVDIPPEDTKKSMIDGDVDIDYVMSKGSLEDVVLALDHMRNEARDVAFEYRETIGQLRERAAKLATLEPRSARKPPTPPVKTAKVRAAAPTSKTRAAPDKIVMPDGQELVRKPRKSTAKPATKKTGSKKPAKSNSGTKKQPKKRASR